MKAHPATARTRTWAYMPPISAISTAIPSTPSVWCASEPCLRANEEPEGGLNTARIKRQIRVPRSTQDRLVGFATSQADEDDACGTRRRAHSEHHTPRGWI